MSQVCATRCRGCRARAHFSYACLAELAGIAEIAAAQPFGMQRQRAPPQMLVPQPDHSVSRTPRPHHADQTGPGPHRGEQWGNTPRTAPPASKDLGMKRTEPQRVRTRVSPLMELQDPEVFEVILIGNNMLPLVKRLSEFQQLSEQMQRAQSGTPPLRPSPGARPAIVAQNIQVFLDSLLAAIGLDDDTPQGNLLKSFLGMWCANGAAGVGSKTQREVRSTKSPRSALQPLHNQPMVAQPYAQASQPTSPPGAASEDERAAALDLIRRRREATRAQKQQQLPAPAILSADEKADIIRNKVVEALNDSGDQDLRPQVHSPPITVAAYSAALREGFGTLRAEQDSEHTPAEHPPTEQVARKNLTRKFVRQAQSLLEQIDTSSKLKTWVNCTDEEAGLTFTQSLCSESSFDIIPTVLAPVGTAVTSRRANAMAAAPAPMESSSTTSNRVAAVAGYTASFRDMRSKFANAVGSISDQEYASSLLASQDLIQQTLQGEGTFKPNQEVFEYLVNVLKGEEEGEASTDRVTLHIRAGIALCNLCLNSSHNRDMTVEAGGIDALSTRLAQAVAEDDFRMQAVMAACFANLAADHKYKELIVQSSAMQSLDQVLSPCTTSQTESVPGASDACPGEKTADMSTFAGTVWSKRGGGLACSRHHLEHMRRFATGREVHARHH